MVLSIVSTKQLCVHNCSPQKYRSFISGYRRKNSLAEILLCNSISWIPNNGKSPIVSYPARGQATRDLRYTVKLVDVRTGELLWESIAKAEQSSNNSGGGLAGALLNAIVTQVVASTIADPTPSLSRRANNVAINNQSRGLLDGPYKQPSENNH